MEKKNLMLQGTQHITIKLQNNEYENNMIKNGIIANK